MGDAPGLSVTGHRVFEVYGSPICFFYVLITPAVYIIFFLSLVGRNLPASVPITMMSLSNSSGSHGLTHRLSTFRRAGIVLAAISFRRTHRTVRRKGICNVFCVPGSFNISTATNQRPGLSFCAGNACLVTTSLLFQSVGAVSILTNTSIKLRAKLTRNCARGRVVTRLRPVIVSARTVKGP